VTQPRPSNRPVVSSERVLSLVGMVPQEGGREAAGSGTRDQSSVTSKMLLEALTTSEADGLRRDTNNPGTGYDGRG